MGRRLHFEQLDNDHPLVQRGTIVRDDKSGYWSWDPNHERITNSTDICGLIAHDQGQLVGIIHYVCRNGRFQSFGTYVWPSRRHRGVGFALWRLVLTWEKPREVYVTVVSDRGKTLVHNVRAAFPKVRFDITEDGQRKLRLLNKRKAA